MRTEIYCKWCPAAGPACRNGKALSCSLSAARAQEHYHVGMHSRAACMSARGLVASLHSAAWRALTVCKMSSSFTAVTLLESGRPIKRNHVMMTLAIVPFFANKQVCLHRLTILQRDFAQTTGLLRGLGRLPVRRDAQPGRFRRLSRQRQGR